MPFDGQKTTSNLPFEWMPCREEHLKSGAYTIALPRNTANGNSKLINWSLMTTKIENIFPPFDFIAPISGAIILSRYF